MKKERIESLRKKITEKEYEQKGLVVDLYHFKLRLKKDLKDYQSGIELKREVCDSIERQIRKRLVKMEEWTEIKQYIENISLGQYKITVRQLDRYKRTTENNNKPFFDEQIILLLRSLMKLEKQSDQEDFLRRIEDSFMPIELSITHLKNGRKEETYKAYSLVKKKIGKKQHGRAWRMRSARDMMDYQLTYDLPTFLANAFLLNAIERFILANEQYYHYAMTRHIFRKSFNDENNVLYLPTDLEFSNDLRDAYKKQELISNEMAIEPRITVNRFAEGFYLKKDEKGRIHHINNPEILMVVLPELLRQMEYIKEKTERRIQQESTYARSFQTKKHINKQTQEVMANNEFLNCFKYVELDNEVDLNLFRKLEKDFIELKEKVPFPMAEDHSFRIKKLGNHKANGIYYAEPIRATIVDVDHPSTFIHEYGHQIDYTYLEGDQMLSESVNFREVYDLYCEELEEQVAKLPVNSPFREQWEGKSKANKYYYLLPTEVFARSFELFLHHKGIESSLLENKVTYSGLVYPKNTRYLKAVANYFNELMIQLKKKEESTNLKTPEKRKSKLIKTVTSSVIPSDYLALPINADGEKESFEQLSLF